LINARPFFVWLHRWAGLVMTAFLVIVGLTGSVMAFREDLDTWLNPELLAVSPRNGAPLDPLHLRKTAAMLYPQARFDSVPMHVRPDRSLEVAFQSQGEASGLPIQIYLDPYTGERLGERRWGEVSLARQDIISFLYRLHMTLALPASTGNVGPYMLGVTALVWTIDCLVSFYLTLPLARRKRGEKPAKSWWGRWKPAWLIKLNAGAYRVNFDIHRAFGLWTWAMLFVFAWSSVAFNLSELYLPVTRALFGYSQAAGTNELPTLSAPLDNPKLDWHEARDIGRALLNEQAHRNGFAIEREEWLTLDREHGVYLLTAHGSLDAGKGGTTFVAFDADSGELRRAVWPGAPVEQTGDVITRWLTMLHMAAVFGVPMQIFVCIMGLVITTLSVTGVFIWKKKRHARQNSAQRKRLAGVVTAVTNR
jgi:uncharacterized iron-regulated membrane protein